MLLILTVCAIMFKNRNIQTAFPEAVSFFVCTSDVQTFLFEDIKKLHNQQCHNTSLSCSNGTASYNEYMMMYIISSSSSFSCSL